MLPVVRDHDGQIFFREWSGGLMSGGFEMEALPVFREGIPKGFEYQLFPENWDHFGGYFKKNNVTYTQPPPGRALMCRTGGLGFKYRPDHKPESLNNA